MVGFIEIYAPDGVSVSPSRVDFDETAPAVPEFRVVVEREVKGSLSFSLNLNGGGSQGTVPGVAIESSDDGWSFARDDSDY